MKFKKADAKTLTLVLRTFADDLDKHETQQRRYVAIKVNNLLDELLEEDFFGTEGQCDPRGDHRD